MKKFVSSLLKKNMLTYLTFFALYFYIMNTLDHTPPGLTYFFIAYLVFSIIESTYEQTIEDRKNGKKKQSASEFFRNVDWFVVMITILICIILYVFLLMIATRH